MAEAIAAARAHPALHIEMHRMDTPGGVKILCDEVGADRVLFGSEAPACAIQGPLNMVRQADLPQADQDRILGGNLARLLGI
jgi:predicted TIM-barrel fold metal-dependent hydrolase